MPTVILSIHVLLGFMSIIAIPIFVLSQRLHRHTIAINSRYLMTKGASMTIAMGILLIFTGGSFTRTCMMLTTYLVAIMTALYFGDKLDDSTGDCPYLNPR